MAVIKLGEDYIRQAFTQVDNLFIRNYLASADGDDVKIYLVALSLASSGYEGEYVSKIASTLSLSEQRVLDGFAYWEKQGLAEIRGDKIFFISVKAPLSPVVKYNAQKFKLFNEELARIFPDKIHSENELILYYDFIESSKMEINALLLIAQYCKDQGGGKASAKYILSVAQSWANENLLKEKDIVSRIEETEAYSEDVKQIFTALGVKRAPTFEDRQLFSSWQAAGFSLSGILTAAKALKKKGGMERLDAYVKELAASQAFTPEEVAEYAVRKQNVHELCISICKNIGVYYSSTDSVAETYVYPWLSLGFDAEALKALSKYCFLRNLHDLESMNQMVGKFAKLGIFTSEDMASFVDKQIRLDDKIRAVYEKCGFVGAIRDKDRDNYRTWEEWGFDEDVIFAVAAWFRDKTFPMTSVNRTLGELKTRGVFTKEGALRYLEQTVSGGKKQDGSKDADGYMKHEYTDEQLKRAFVNFDNWD